MAEEERAEAETDVVLAENRNAWGSYFEHFEMGEITQWS